MENASPSTYFKAHYHGMPVANSLENFLAVRFKDSTPMLTKDKDGNYHLVSMEKLDGCKRFTQVMKLVGLIFLNIISLILLAVRAIVRHVHASRKIVKSREALQRPIYAEDRAYRKSRFDHTPHQNLEKQSPIVHQKTSKTLAAVEIQSFLNAVFAKAEPVGRDGYIWKRLETADEGGLQKFLEALERYPLDDKYKAYILEANADKITGEENLRRALKITTSLDELTACRSIALEAIVNQITSPELVPYALRITGTITSGNWVLGILLALKYKLTTPENISKAIEIAQGKLIYSSLTEDKETFIKHLQKKLQKKLATLKAPLSS